MASETWIEELGLQLSQAKVSPPVLWERIKKEKKPGTKVTLGVRKSRVGKKEYWYFRATYRVPAPDEEHPNRTRLKKINLVGLSEKQKDDEGLITKLKERFNPPIRTIDEYERELIELKHRFESLKELETEKTDLARKLAQNNERIRELEGQVKYWQENYQEMFEKYNNLKFLYEGKGEPRKE